MGKRVTGEINLPCGDCEYCKKGLERHCPNRTVVGIQNRPGAFAEFICLPEKNLVEIPPTVSDSEAVFIEPLAAALEILDQVDIQSDHRVLLFGDGKLGQLIARVLQTTGCGLMVVGKHEKKLALIRSLGISACHVADFQPVFRDIVIDATGSPAAFETALKCVKPRGILVLKSTFAGKAQWNPSRLVVNEITLVGSRCGRFSRAIEFLLKEKPDFSPLIEATLPLDRGIEAFHLSKEGNSLKVLLEMP
jgi:threonine dehydrogenase-like Zn-dependent dehydrogenase